MSSREPHIPLVLWISTAILAHIATGGGADQVAHVYEQRAQLHSLVTSLRERLEPSPVLEVALLDDAQMAPRQAEPPPPDPASAVDEPKPPESPDKKLARPDPKSKPKAKPEESPKPKKPEVKKPEAVVKLVPTAAPPAAPPPPPKIDHRIAVQQHVKPDQDDNANAHFVSDEANHVEEESVARITSHDRDEANPTPGGRHAGPTPDPGNGDHTKIGESDDNPGDPTHAPGENAQQTAARHTEQAPPQVAANNPVVSPAKPAGAPRAVETTAPAVGGARPASPEVIAGTEGEYHLDPARSETKGAAATTGPGSARRAPPVVTSTLEMLGLNGTATPSGVNLNLTQAQVVAVVGQDQLTREREADGARRKSVHRGSWAASGFERWRPAIENYVSSVKPGNQTALNTARVPFATYLNSMHNRIHPIFADDFLDSLDGLPANHPLSDQGLFASLEIILSRDDGHVVRMGVTKTSGVTAFDIAALDAVQRASPFGKPPTPIVSPDGNVYFHWEFHRDRIYACSTMNARPFLLNVPTPSEPPTPSTPSPSILPTDPRERSAPPAQQGLLAPPPSPLPPASPLAPTPRYALPRTAFPRTAGTPS